MSPGPATIRLMKFWSAIPGSRLGQGKLRRLTAVRPPHSPCRDRHRPAGGRRRCRRSPGREVVEETVDEHTLADVQGRFHRLRGNLVGLDDPGLDPQGEAQGQRDDDDELEQAPSRVCGLGIEGFRPSPRRSRRIPHPATHPRHPPPQASSVTRSGLSLRLRLPPQRPQLQPPAGSSEDCSSRPHPSRGWCRGWSQSPAACEDDCDILGDRTRGSSSDLSD